MVASRLRTSTPSYIRQKPGKRLWSREKYKLLLACGPILEDQTESMMMNEHPQFNFNSVRKCRERRKRGQAKIVLNDDPWESDLFVIAINSKKTRGASRCAERVKLVRESLCAP